MAVNPYAPPEFNLEVGLCPSYYPLPWGELQPVSIPGGICEGCGRIVVEEGVTGCTLTLTNLRARSTYRDLDNFLIVPPTA